jgi:hypothetical protein
MIYAFSEASVTTRYMKEVIEKSRCINLIHGDVRLLNGTACLAYWIKNHNCDAPCAGCCLYIEAIGNLRGQRSPKRKTSKAIGCGGVCHR